MLCCAYFFLAFSLMDVALPLFPCGSCTASNLQSMYRDGWCVTGSHTFGTMLSICMFHHGGLPVLSSTVGVKDGVLAACDINNLGNCHQVCCCYFAQYE